MIELNLVPDVKHEYIKAQHQRALAVTVSIFAGLAAAGIVVLLGLLIGVQVARDKLTDSAIETETKTLSDLDKKYNLASMLTIQNQLTQLKTQNDSRTINSRIFNVLAAITPPAPNDVRFSSIKLDPVAKTISLEGKAPNGYGAVDIFKKTIANQKFIYKKLPADIKSRSDLKDVPEENVPLATGVNVVSTNVSSDGGHTVVFSIVFTYADDLFSNAISDDAQIVGPTSKIDVTDSSTYVPDIFTAKPTTEGSK